MGTHYKGSAEDVRALNAFIKLMRCADSVETRSAAHLAAAGITPTQFGVLEALYHLGPLRPSRLAEKHLKSRGNLTLVVDNLERDGLVERVRCPSDRRVINIHLTDAGRTRIAKLFPEHLAVLVETMSALTPEEQDRLSELCRKLGRRTNAGD